MKYQKSKFDKHTKLKKFVPKKNDLSDDDIDKQKKSIIK